MNTDQLETSDYLKYRGKCKEYSENFVSENPNLRRLVRGYYHCPFWGKQQHWWAEELVHGAWYIVDQTKDQFPSKGIGTYEEFTGEIECSHCGKKVTEEDARIEGRYAFCSLECNMSFVGL